MHQFVPVKVNYIDLELDLILVGNTNSSVRFDQVNGRVIEMRIASKLGADAPYTPSTCSHYHDLENGCNDTFAN